MISGEGSVFLSLLIFGAYRLRKAINEEKALHQQQKNFLLSVTHELKSPLASIKLYLQTILKRDLDKEKQKSFIENSLTDIERLDTLVENMLIATKIESKSYTYQKEHIDLGAIVKESTQALAIKLKENRNFELHIADAIPFIGDSFALSLVVSNLLENAFKYTSKDDTISIKLLRNGPAIVLSISDTGSGIPEMERLKIFDKFYRIGNEDTRKTKGTGLGLFIVKQIVDHHSGIIRVKSNKPSGSIFEITFLD